MPCVADVMDSICCRVRSMLQVRQPHHNGAASGENIDRGREAMGRPALLVSHGFQPNYEKAFANGLARNGLPVTVVTSGRSLVDEFDPRIRTVQLRGSQDPRRAPL